MKYSFFFQTEPNMDGKTGMQIGYIISNGPFSVISGCPCFLTSFINIPFILVVDPEMKDTLIPTCKFLLNFTQY